MPQSPPELGAPYSRQFPSKYRNASRSTIVRLTMVADAIFLSLALGIGLLLRALSASVLVTVPLAERAMVLQMAAWTVVTPAGWFWFADGIRAMTTRSFLPFVGTNRITRTVYWQRLTVVLWAIAAHAVLLCLCLLLTGRPALTKMLLASIIAALSFVVGKSIPNPQLSFAASMGVFSLTMMVIAIAGLVIRFS